MKMWQKTRRKTLNRNVENYFCEKINWIITETSCAARWPPQYAPPLLTLTFDLLTLKSVWESHVTWGTPVQRFVFLGLLVFELEPMYATSDRQTDRRTDGRTTDADDRLMPPPLRGGGIIMLIDSMVRRTTAAGHPCYESAAGDRLHPLSWVHKGRQWSHPVSSCTRHICRTHSHLRPMTD